MLQLKPLSQRIAEIHEEAERKVDRLNKVEEIIQLLASTKMMRNNAVKANLSTNVTWYASIYLGIWNLPLEMVISELCPIIRSYYGSDCNFTLEVFEYCSTLNTRNKNVQIQITVYEGDMRECELVPIIELRSDEEVEEYRVKRSFKMRCD